MNQFPHAPRLRVRLRRSKPRTHPTLHEGCVKWRGGVCCARYAATRD
jgi:hypothetical protein